MNKFLRNKIEVTVLDRIKNVTIAAVLFGALGGYAGMTATNSINERVSKAVQAAEAAHTPSPAPVAAVAPKH